MPESSQVAALPSADLLDPGAGARRGAAYDASSRSVESDAAIRDALRLSMIEGVGPRIRSSLLMRFGDATAVLAATARELRSAPGVGSKLISRILASGEIDVDAQLNLCREKGIDLLLAGTPDYPTRLSEIHDAPAVLYARGKLTPRDALAVGIVGSRHATRYGLRQAERLAASLARAGVTIVSGLARGIDAAAHRGALAAGGRTIAVLGSGLQRVYPPEHVGLAEEIAESGAVLTESPPETPPMPGAFPQRNRIISGLSLGAIIVEAPLQSGALITARLALEQEREVFAVPGPADSRASRGCHRLIRDGAKLVETAEDVLEELGPLPTPSPGPQGETVRRPAELMLNDAERAVLEAVSEEPTPVDQVIADAALAPAQVLATLSILEVRRLIRRCGGAQVVRI